MCGIVGVAGAVTFKEEGIFKQLLVIDSLRGEDSTGVASVSRMRDVNVVKSVGDPFQLFETRGFTDIMKTNNNVLIGHNRYATVGRISRKTAHPFEFSKVVGVHNGTLKNKYSLHKGSDFDVDSEALYHHINEKGLEDAIDVAEGAYALVWYNKEKDTLNFLRNKERPLFTVLTEDKRCLYWASEAWMLEVALARENIKHGDVTAVPVDTHMSYEIPDFNGTFDKARVKNVAKRAKVVSLPDPQKKTTTPTPVTGAAFYQKTIEFTVKSIENDYSAQYAVLHSDQFPLVDFRCYLSFKDDHDLKAHVGNKIKAKVSRMAVNVGNSYWKVSPDSVELVRPFAADRLMSEAEFNSKYSECCWCSSPVTYDEDYEIISKADVLCSVCKDDKEVREFLPNLKVS